MTRDPRSLGSAWTRFQRHGFVAPAPELAAHVEQYWMASWSYAEPYRQLIVPYPNVQLTFRGGAWMVHGVASRHQIKVLTGTGGVLGVAFRPGCFRPFLRASATTIASVSTITDRSVDATAVFGPGLPTPTQPAPNADDVAAVELFLRERRPEPDPAAVEAAAVVAQIAARAEYTRVDVLAADLGTGVRRLQRLFAEYVGVGPKWVIRRYRLREVTERLAGGAAIDWAALAAELGYVDQAHFARDFKKMFGEPPTSYAARY